LRNYEYDRGGKSNGGQGYSPANPNTTYSVDGMAVTLDTFIHRGGHLLQDRFALLEDAARSSVPTLLKYAVSSNNGRLVRDFGLNEEKANPCQSAVVLKPRFKVTTSRLIRIAVLQEVAVSLLRMELVTLSYSLKELRRPLVS
jgi:hypothetical protein